MASRTLFVPAADLAEARVIADGVAAGRLGHLDHYLDQAAAERVRDHLNRLGTRHCELFRIEVRAVDDGTIANVWPADRIGDVAATITLFAMGALVGLASLWERLA